MHSMKNKFSNITIATATKSNISPSFERFILTIKTTIIEAYRAAIIETLIMLDVDMDIE